MHPHRRTAAVRAALEAAGIGRGAERAAERPRLRVALERAVFVSVLHRLFVSGSDRSCEKWMVDYAIPGIDDLRLHHLYRAMAWLGEELEPAAEADLAPRCVKDEIEERLFERWRDLFTDLSLVFMDTTTLSFHGAGGESLGAHGQPKDHRPDLRQMVLAVVLDGEGRPVCTEMLAGNTADMTVLLPVVDRLRRRFGIGRVCVMADRGMISAATIAALEERGLAYILGARERGTAVIREIVLKDERPFVPLWIPGSSPGMRGRDNTQLFVKQVTVHGARYIVCRNEAEAEKAGPTARRSSPTWRSGSRAGTRRWSATPVTVVICARRAPARRSRSMPASSPTRPVSTASSCSGPTAR